MKNSKFRYLFLGALLLLAFGVVRLYFYLTDDFRIANIIYPLPHHPEWEIKITKEEQAELNSILDQEYSYIGKGAQSYVFGSNDGQYVLKFFKFKHLKPSWLHQFLPDIPVFSAFKERSRLRKERKLFSAFNGYKLAYDVHKPESALIFIQLNPSGKTQWIVVHDKLGLPRNIDLGRVVFIVQRKGKTFRAILHELLAQNQIDIAKKRIHQIFKLYLKEYSKGIFDHDHGVMQNTGFISDEPFHLDVGKLKAEPVMRLPEVYEKDLIKVAYKIALWIQNKHPEHKEALFKNMEQSLSMVTGKPFEMPAVIPQLKH